MYLRSRVAIFDRRSSKFVKKPPFCEGFHQKFGPHNLGENSHLSPLICWSIFHEISCPFMIIFCFYIYKEKFISDGYSIMQISHLLCQLLSHFDLNLIKIQIRLFFYRLQIRFTHVSVLRETHMNCKNYLTQSHKLTKRQGTVDK